MGITPAIIGAVASVASAGVGIASSLSAAGAQKKAAQTAANTQLHMYDTTRADLLPYMNAGTGVLPNLNAMLGTGGTGPNTALMLQNLQNYPGYQFALGQGVQALDRSAASRGLVLSGGQMKDITSYGQGMADQLFGTYWNQNMQLANLGENAAAMVGQQGTALAGQAGQAQLAAGTASAAGIMGAGNQIQGLLSNADLLGMMSGGGGGQSFPFATGFDALTAPTDVGLPSVGVGDLPPLVW